MSGARTWLDLAARAALRAGGDVEPNPMVGAVIVREGRILGLGHHRCFGGLHAEREALADCRRRGESPRGATAYVTLEPCRHHGKQPPCTDALIEAGVAGVVYARQDPHGASGGGAGVLRRAGITCELSGESTLATRLSDPFVKRVTTGLPWVVAKWAQSADGCMTTPPGADRRISNALSHARVHRLRARVDAIITGIGTVLADDPMLTARGVRRVRRVARRVVIDSRGRLPATSRLATSAGEAPVLVMHAGGGVSLPRGVEGASAPGADGCVDLSAMLRLLASRYDATNVLVEGGPRLLKAFFDAGLVDEAVVYEASHVLGRVEGSGVAPQIKEDWGFEPVRRKPLGGDVERVFRRRLGRARAGDAGEI